MVPQLLSSLSPCNSSISLKLSPNESFFTKKKKASVVGKGTTLPSELERNQVASPGLQRPAGPVPRGVGQD